MADASHLIDPDTVLRMVREEPIIAYDTETSGLEPNTDFICGYVVADFSQSLYVPVRHEGGGNIPDVEDFERALADAFKERARLGYRTVGHFLGFDLRFSNRRGIFPWSPLEDTAINECLIDDRTIGYGLDDTARRYQVTPKKGDELYAELARRFGGIPDRKQMKNYWRLPGDLFVAVDYAVGDGITTLEVWEKQQRLLDSEELRVPWQLECDLIPYVARLNLRGMRIDMDYASTVDERIKADIAERKKIFPAGFNARSAKEVEKLYLDNGYTSDRFDRTPPSANFPQGQVSFTEKWLENGGGEIGEAILGIRRLEKAKDSFIKPLVETNHHNGRVHPVLYQSKTDDYGVAGARFSCTAPNMQAFPKRNKAVGMVVRPLIIADEGMLLEEGDAMQQEPRLFTHYSGDEALMHGYSTDPLFSIHQRANDMMFGGQDYDKAKRMAMGILSMMYPKMLSSHLNISVKEATALRNQFLYDAFPDIGTFQRQAVKVYEQTGYVMSILGRRARLENSKFAYQAVSRIIQNSGGDHNKTCVLRACQYEDAYPDKINILMPVHDSIIWQRQPDFDVKEFVAILENVPHEPQFNLTVPIPFEVGSGRHWGETSYGPKIKDKKGWVTSS